MRYLSLCSGIEAASVAWESLGWKPVAFCEIEPFPSAVLAHHYPDVPNLRDMTTWREWDADILAAADVLCAGTPCQSFSVAGARRGLDDERGNLTLEFVRIANAIDDIRRGRGADPAIIVWENVPGVLSSRDNAFGCFLAGLAGESEPLVAPGKRWENAGVVLGPQRTVAWRTLDAQYFGLAQRRKRVFVVASAGTRFDPCAVLFESEGVRRDTAPSREAREGVAATITSGAPNGGPAHGQRSGHAREANLIPETAGTLTERMQGSSGWAPYNEAAHLVPEVAGCLQERDAKGSDSDTKPGHLIPQMFKIRGGVDTYEKVDGTKGTAGKGALVAAAQDQFLAEPVAFQLAGDRGDPSVSVSEGKAFTLPANPMSDRGQAVAFQSKASAHQSMNPGDVAPSLDVAKSGGTAVAVYVYNQAIDGDCAATLTEAAGGTNTSGPKVMAAGFKPNQSAQARGIGFEEEMAPTLEGGGGGNNKPTILNAMQVRRLTPTECERLQGFPGGYTSIPWRPIDTDPKGAMPCLKQTVRATLVLKSGKHLTATNYIRNPVDACARAGMATGEGYELCRDVCDQPGHAEINVLKAAGRKPGCALDSVLYIEGHTYACQPCIEAAKEAGVRAIVFGPPPGNAPDGPRYKALGNSWAVPVVRWIGARIQTIGGT